MTEKNNDIKVPFHVAIIPDGNRRWAKKKGLKPWEGHEAGAKMIEELSHEALKLGVKCLSFWGSSVNNLQARTFQETRALLKVYEKYFKKLVRNEEIYHNKTRINVFGKWEELLPGSLKKIIKEGIEKTKGHSNNFLNFLLAYAGDDDMLEAVKKIAKKVHEEGGKIKITKKLIAESLMTRALPPVDLLIRTGTAGDPHNSAGFLMWQTQDSQYYFSEKMFPDFNKNELKKAIMEYSRRERRIGR